MADGTDRSGALEPLERDLLGLRPNARTSRPTHTTGARNSARPSLPAKARSALLFSA